MEKKQDDARNTETEKKPGAAGQHDQPGSAAPDKVTDVELTNERSTPEKTTAQADKTDKAAAGKPVASAAGGSVPPADADKDESSAGKGTKGPLIGALVVVAAIAAGGYYYAQNNHSQSENNSQTTSEPAASAPADTPASDAAQADQGSAPDTSSSASSTTDNAEPAQNGDTASATASGSDAQTPAGEGTAGADAASSATNEADGSNGNAPADSATANNEPAQTGSEATTDAASAAVTNEHNEDASAQASPDKSDTTDASETAPAATETSSAGSSAASTNTANATDTAASGTGGFGGSLPADIRDQLDRQSAQIIALRDQLESSQKQLQQLQTTRLQAARDETTLFVVNDVSRLVTMAQNELAIVGNLENAVTALETGIKAIDQADAPVLAGLRGALSADIVTLKSAPAIGVDAQFAQIAALSEKIDALPMLAPDQAGAKPMAGQSAQGASTGSDTNETNSAAATEAWYERAWNEVKTWPGAAWDGLRSDLGGIVRVEKLADPNQLLLTVDQAAQLRGNLKQYLHFAQQALLNGQQGIWTASLETVVKGIKQSFNQDSVETQQVLAQLQQLLKAGVRPELPSITQSVKAVEETRKQLKSTNPGQE
ncbi:uroporphyrinogen-III C-methyltransferase [Advenella mimigardefordensis]|uniref:HemX domain-containing protein n=1 Tax=Advenella mimigardefordensis (strain DSM 17166 / LMG 22922 / DPN7) TaxID=1247726 RepID=W0PAP1_ADVMD|nr:uroporphyrinogen-III C-methyltransferase [Advenella mimigardefordensis]AHG63914.1 HemX domain-containing protein [Advenella mimigardefordensis DPN7]